MQKKKSLGVLEWPTAELVGYDTRRREATIKLDAGSKTIKIKMGLGCVHTLARLTREILIRQRDFIKSEWAEFKALNTKTGANIPE